MHIRRNQWTAALVLLLSLSIAVAGRTYQSYYTCLPGSVTALVITNASVYEHDEAYTLTLYDAEGAILHTHVGGLTSYESVVLFLTDLVENPGELSWGAAIIESNVLLLAGVWIGTEDQWVSVSNIRTQTLSTQGLDIAYFWYGANYANTENRRTGIAVVNPGETGLTGTAFVYDSAGVLQNYSDFALGAHGSAFFRPETVFPVGENSWGLIDIRSTAPILVASEYYDAMGTLLDIDIIDTVYYLQTQQEDSGDS